MECSRNRLNFRSLCGIEKFLVGLLFARFAVIVVRSPLPLNPPEIWRQVVTLGVSMRYWMRWTVETGVRVPLLPAVLDSGDTHGIMPMEFPALNLISAPWFAFGPALGRALAIVFCNAIVLFLVLWNASAWRGRKVLGVDAFAAMLLLPIFSINLYWSERFMPDFISMTLVCLAVGLSWSENRWLRSFLLASLGLLMKPTAIIVFGLFLVHDRRWKKWREVSGWVALSILTTFLYYKPGLEWMKHYREIPGLFGVDARPILPGIQAFFTHLPTLFKFYWERAFFLGGPAVVLGISLWSKIRRGTSMLLPLWGLSLLQIFVIAMLDGVYLFYNHDYYLLGTGPVFCLLFVDALRKCEPRWLKALLILGVCIPLGESMAVDLKTLYKTPKLSIWTLDQQVRDLKARHPEFPWGQGKVFRTPPEDFPVLGLHFGERSGSHTSPYGFFWTDSSLPSGCVSIDHTENLVLVSCH